jgi:hypothetical protein
VAKPNGDQLQHGEINLTFRRNLEETDLLERELVECLNPIQLCDAADTIKWCLTSNE